MKISRFITIAAMLYGLETVSLTKRQEAEIEVAELKMLRFQLGVTRMDKISEHFFPVKIVGKWNNKLQPSKC